MQFQSTHVRKYWQNLAFGSLFDILIVIAISAVWDGSFWVTFFVILLAFWLLPIFFLLKGSIFKYALNYLGRKDAVKTLLREFKAKELPTNNEYYLDVDSYFEQITQDEAATKEARNYAAFVLGQFNMMQRYSKLDLFHSYSLFEEALGDYFDAQGTQSVLD
ncbi:MAG: hypothetical protein JKY41_13625 [Rhodobacteraceae bacterium]|nr:hypothetical protein [Paracoccaceae bacterium]